MIFLSYKGFINIGLSFPLNGGENKNKARRYFNNGIPCDPKTEAPFNFYRLPRSTGKCSIRI